MWDYFHETEIIRTCGNIYVFTVLSFLDYLAANQKRCLERDEDDCAFLFTYKVDNVTDEVRLYVQRDRSKFYHNFIVIYITLHRTVYNKYFHNIILFFLGFIIILLVQYSILIQHPPKTLTCCI